MLLDGAQARAVPSAGPFPDRMTLAGRGPSPFGFGKREQERNRSACAGGARGRRGPDADGCPENRQGWYLRGNHIDMVLLDGRSDRSPGTTGIPGLPAEHLSIRLPPHTFGSRWLDDHVRAQSAIPFFQQWQQTFESADPAGKRPQCRPTGNLSVAARLMASPPVRPPLLFFFMLAANS